MSDQQPLTDDEKVDILRIAKTWGSKPKKVWSLITEAVGKDRRQLAVSYLEETLDLKQAEQSASKEWQGAFLDAGGSE